MGSIVKTISVIAAAVTILAFYLDNEARLANWKTQFCSIVPAICGPRHVCSEIVPDEQHCNGLKGIEKIKCLANSQSATKRCDK